MLDAIELRTMGASRHLLQLSGSRPSRHWNQRSPHLKVTCHMSPRPATPPPNVGVVARDPWPWRLQDSRGVKQTPVSGEPFKEQA